MDGPFAFTATCPRCGHPRSQDEHSRRALRRSLALGHLIEGYCTSCDDLWPISTDERALLAVTLAAEGSEAFHPTAARFSALPR